MRIAIMGAGALGGYFGGRLAAAGNDVTLIARGAHLEAIRTQGLHIHSPKGDLHLPNIRATDDPADVGPVDVVMFMVKNYDVEAAAEAIKPMLEPDTMVTTFQNGVSAPDRLAAIIGADRVIPGVARIPADIKEPGVIRHNADFDMLLFGESDGARSQRCEQFASVLKEAGTTAIVPENINHELWAKFVMQASLSSPHRFDPAKSWPVTRICGFSGSVPALDGRDGAGRSCDRCRAAPGYCCAAMEISGGSAGDSSRLDA